MVTIGRKEYRKPYILTEGGYQDMMRATWDKSIWNDILEIDPVWAEFLFTRSELPDAATAAEIRYLKYIKQSEFKKYYLNGLDYEEMEYLWTGPIPGVFPVDFDYDFPWRPGEGGGVFDNPEVSPPFIAVCDAETDGCYCPGQNKNITITGTYPISGITIVFGEGEYFVDFQGLGTNSVVATLNTPSNRSGLMRLRVIMALPNGNYCDSEVNLYECSEQECCPDECDLEWDFDNSDETVSPPGSANVFITGGTGPYFWEISSEDGLWTLDESVTTGLTNVVNAAAGACGSATITVTDSCGCETEGGVRNPSSGQWVLICNDVPQSLSCCKIAGPPNDVAWNQVAANNWEAESIQGKYRQLQRDFLDCAAKGYGSLEDCQADGDYRGCGSKGVGFTCITRDDPTDNPRANGASCAAGANPLNRQGGQWFRTGCTGSVGRCDCCQYLTGTTTTRLWLYEWQCL